MIPPRFVPEGILQLIEIQGDEKILLHQLSMSSKNRDRINQIRTELLMINPKRNLAVGENNSIRYTKDARVPEVHHDV